MFQRFGDHSKASRLSRRAFLRKTLIQTAAVAGGTWVWRSGGGLPSLLVAAAAEGLAGIVRDLLSGQPIGGAAVFALGSSTVADERGYYQLSLPSGSHEVTAVAPGYLTMSRTALVPPALLDFAMLPANPTPEQQDGLYALLVQTPEWPAAGSPLPTISPDHAAAAITIPDTIVVRWPDGSQSTLPLDEYLRHVVPAEMPASWPAQALRTQAVAARTYAVAYSQAYGYICTTPSCQAYGNATYPTTDDAVYSTHNQVIVADGLLAWAFFFAQCNGVTTRNSEQALANTEAGNTCSVNGWSYVSYCRARPCSGHASYGNSCGYHGHGVGMCQWGARDFGNQGLAYDQILARFYSGIQLIGTDGPPRLLAPANGYLAKTGVPITLSWSGTSASYTVVVLDSAGTVRMTSSGSATSAPVPTSLPAGTYSWHVAGVTGSATPVTSVTRRFTLANNIYQTALPSITKQ